MGSEMCIRDSSLTKRPLVGWTVINEYYIDFNKKNMRKDVATIVHEVLHALYFHPNLFHIFPKNKFNQSFFYNNNNQVYLRGNSLLDTCQKHFNCNSLEQSKSFKIKIL